MKKCIVVSLIAAFAFSCVMFIYAEPTKDANDGRAVERASSAAGSLLSSYYRATETVTLADGSPVQLYPNLIGDDNAGNSIRLFYAPIPFVIVEDEDFFDQKTNVVHFRFGLRDCKAELPQLIQGIGYKDCPLVMLPIKAIRLSFTTGSEEVSETIAIYEDSCLSYNLDSHIHVTHKVANEQLIELLKSHPYRINILVTLTTEFKDDNAAMAKAAFQKDFSLRVRETVFGSRHDVNYKNNRVTYMPINQFKDLVRDIEAQERVKVRQTSSVMFLGETDDRAEKAIESFLKQNKDAFKEVTLEDVLAANGSITVMDKGFLTKELKPQEVDNLVKNHEQASKMHKLVESNFDELKQLATESANEEEFYEKCSKSKSIGGGVSYGPVGVNANVTNSSSHEEGSRNANLDKLFSMLKSGKYNKSDIMQEFSDKISGELHESISKPKELSLLRLSESSFERLNSFVYLWITSSWSENQKLNRLLSIESQKGKTVINAKISELEATVAQQSALINKLTDERDSLKETVCKQNEQLDIKDSIIKVFLKSAQR